MIALIQWLENAIQTIVKYAASGIEHPVAATTKVPRV